MSEFKVNGDYFGRYCRIEMHRYGAENEFYLHKVINSLRSNTYTEVPIKSGLDNSTHESVEDVISVICCGISEDKVFRVKLEDVEFL